MANSYKTKKINGIDAVYLGDLPLKMGVVDYSQNSVPYINSQAVQSLLALDNAMGKTGEKYKITSAMGGSHNPGTYSHGGGWKIDVVPYSGVGNFSTNAQNVLKGWVGNGAIGYHNAGSGYHWDLGLSNRMNNNNLFSPTPNFINATPQIAQQTQGGMLGNLALYQMLNEANKERLNRYDIARAINSSNQAIDKNTQQAVEDINTQMSLGRMTPEQVRGEIAATGVTDLVAAQQAQDALARAREAYQGAPSAQNMADLIKANYEQLLEQARNTNPVIAQMGSIPGYQIDAKEYGRRLAMDNAYNNVMAGRALMHASSNPQLAAVEAQLARTPQNTAEQYLQQANAQYQMNLANRLGIPYQEAMNQAKAMQDIYKAIAPNVVSANKEAVAQEQQNLRNYIENVEKPYVDVQKNVGTAGGNYMSAINRQDEINRLTNEVAAEAMKEALEEKNKMAQAYPKLVTEKYQTEQSGANVLGEPLLRGNTSLVTTGVDATQKAIANINTQLENASEEYGKSLRKMEDILARREELAQKAQMKNETSDTKLKTSTMQTAIKMSRNSLTGEKDPSTINEVAIYLASSGLYDKEEIKNILEQLYQDKGEEKGKK